MKKRFLRTVAVVLALVMLFSVCLVYAEETGIPQRQDIEGKYKWRLEDLYKDQAAWEKDVAKLQKELSPNIQKYKGKLTSTKAVLACLKLADEIGMVLEKVYAYAYMKQSENTADSAASEALSKADTLYADMTAAVSFIEPELLAKPEATLKQYYLNNPAFKVYKYYFTTLLDKKAHVLTKSEEELLAMTGDMASSPNDIYTKISTADIEIPVIKDEEGKEIKLTRGRFSAYLDNKNRDLRKEAFEKHFGTFDKVKNSVASALNAEVKKNIFYAKARKYDSALASALHSTFNVPTSVYDNLLKSVNNNIGYLHKYVGLRKKVLNIDKVHYYDMYCTLVDDYEMQIPYEDAKKMILDGLKPLGPEYLKGIQTAFDSSWIDVYETESKETGAYSYGIYGSHPFIMLNYSGTSDDMLTTAHELGHTMHSFYANANQAYRNANYSTFTAEVASTTNELIMTQYLLDRAKNNQEKLYLINSLLENIRGSLYTQVMYAEFEKAIHERVEKGEALSAETMNEMWGNLMQKYYGADFEVDPLVKLWWARIPHFYMNFYVFNYATAIAAAYPLSQGLSKGEAGAFDKYMDFLKAGGSDYPVEILRKAGVDMTTTMPVDDVLAVFNSLVDQMEKILKEEGKIQ